MFVRRAFVSALGLVAAVLVSGACSRSEVVFRDGKQIGATATTKSGSGGSPLSFQVRATGDGGGATIRPPLELWAPFRLEATLGAYEGKGQDWGPDGSLGISVIDATFLTTAYGAVSVRRSANGLSVQAESGGGSTFPAVTFDTLTVEVALAHDGSQLVFEARRRGDATFVEIGRANQTFAGPYVPSLDASDLRRGARAGIDDLVLVDVADPPDLSTAEGRAGAALTRAVQALLDAQKAADSATPDAAAARTALETGSARLGDALTELASLGSSTKKARGALAGTKRAADSAAKKLARGVAPRKTTPLFRKMATTLASALARLR